MEYHFYILPLLEKHDHQKYCYSYNDQPENLDHILCNTNIEEKFKKNELCLKCAFYAQLWYDHMILERKQFHITETKTKTKSESKFAFHQFDISDKYQNIDHPTLQFISHQKAKEALTTLSAKRAYKQSDIDAYDKSMEILQYINEMYEKYKILIFYETYL